jgi:hypothetical protein
MSWQNEIVRMVRFLINDIDATSYSDDRLEETVLVSAQLLISGVDFDNTYTVDVDTLTLSPDPTTLTTKDNNFINLLAIKTACIILGSEAKTLAAQSYRIKDGPSSIDISMAYQATKQLYTDLCDKLDKMILDYKAGNSVAGQAIITPYTQDGINQGFPIRNFY